MPDRARLEIESSRPSVYAPIGDYGLIGDCRTAALISRDGSIDWLCVPRFDSPSVFAALVDQERGGRFRIRPVGSFETVRRYVGESAALETTFRSGTGVLRLTDVMPVASEADKRRELWPDHEILRVLECLEGEVRIEVAFDPRPQYGRLTPEFVETGAGGLICQEGPLALALRSELPLQPARGPGGARGEAVLRRGDRRSLSLVVAHGLPLVTAPLGHAAGARLHRSVRWWQEWASGCRYDGPYRDAVVRSALTLKLMTYAPSGAIVAAPTTSLPEHVGGVRNWDYRFCWLRDASMTLRALLELGYGIEGEAFLSWILHATRLTWPELQILYDVYGESRLPERELPYLEGYAGSRPVRIGNAAADQLQLDTYGEVMDAAYQYIEYGGRLDRTTGRMLAGLAKTVCRRWREPDEGIWETRGGRRHHTYSKAMCWIALDRLVRLARAGHIPGPIVDLERELALIRAAIETHGYSERARSYVSVFDGEEVDASLLLLLLYGYADASAPRMRATCARVHERLGVNGLLHRYLDDDGLSGREGAFGICSFWAVECRALEGDSEGAARAFDHVLSFANDLGLFAEEIDPATGAALGNFPQAFTHVGLINAALTLAGRSSHRTTAGEEKRT
jgi:GH15 family glucan-1,4-alpha-glucosidase